jgi:uncharacterized cofD-like protein
MSRKRSNHPLSDLPWLRLGGLLIGTVLTGIGWTNALLALVGMEEFSHRIAYLLALQFLPQWSRITIPLVAGALIILWAGLGMYSQRNRPAPEEALPTGDADREKYPTREPHIVAIGGGTGMPGLLRGLTRYTRNITAIVTVADDGGSSGRLRKEFGLLPPGDFRNNMAALARDETLMTQVLQYRFGARVGQSDDGESSGQTLQGHAFGNLLLAALTGITGSFDEALLAAQRVLALRGRVLPSTLANVTLMAEVLCPGGTVEIAGESAISGSGGQIERVWLEPPARAYPPALRAIFQADLIVIGPGSLYTSILPNLLIADLAEALVRANAPVLYVCNLATQPGETDDYTVADHIEAIRRHTPERLLDAVLANDNLSVPSETGGGQTCFVRPVAPERLSLILADLVDEARPWRHDSDKLARSVMAYCFARLTEPTTPPT